MFDKEIHKNEFRLRVLTTNKCNKNCYNCLNDFQTKIGEQFIDPKFVARYLHEYGNFMRRKSQPSIVTFSGGEPGIHEDLLYMVKTAKSTCDVVKIDTNGKAYYNDIDKYVDNWHIHVMTPFNDVLYEFDQKVVYQIVIHDHFCNNRFNPHLQSIEDFIKRNPSNKIKLFFDFFGNYDMISETISYFIKKYKNVESRFTGKQVNRGRGCYSCNLDCITLKALWLFPNNTCSSCPQGVRKIYETDPTDIIRNSFITHMFK